MKEKWIRSRDQYQKLDNHVRSYNKIAHVHFMRAQMFESMAKSKYPNTR